MIDKIADRELGARARGGETVITHVGQHFDHCFTCGIQIDHKAPPPGL
jgi:hypothetical protein